MNRLVIATCLLLVSGCVNDPTDNTAPGGAPRFAAGAAGIQGVFLGGYPSRAYGINEAGLTVGSVDGNGIAAVWTAPGTPNVVGPGLLSQFNDVNDNGVAVGYSPVEGGAIHAMRWTQADGFEDIGTLRPGSNSYAQAINNAGQIVGNDQQGGAQPFLWSASNGMTALAILPGSTNATPFDINDAGAVVGESQAELDGINHGVLWPASGGVVDLGSLGGRFSTAHGINSSGQVVGWSMVASEELHAFIWSEATGMVDLSTWGSACAGASQAEAISDEGVVVGACEGRPVIWTRSQGMRELGTPDGGSDGVAYDINSKGQVVGTFGLIRAALWVVETTPPVVDPGPVNIQRTALWDGEARGINSDRAIVGFGSFQGATSSAIIWWPGLVSPRSLPLLPGDQIGLANAINDAWQIVGTSGSPISHAVLWQPNPNRTEWTVHDLGVSPVQFGGTQEQAINNAGVVVGTTDGNGFVWVPSTPNGSTGTVRRVCEIVMGAQCRGSTANGINDAGQIAGTSDFFLGSTFFNDAAVVWDPPAWTSGHPLPYIDPADPQPNLILGMDAAGNVVGTTVVYDAAASPSFTYHCANRTLPAGTQTCAVALMWPAGGGAPIDLGTLGGSNTDQANAVAAVGAAHELQVVGISSDASGFHFPFRWTQATGMQRLPLPSGSERGGAWARGINTRGDIVGSDGASRTQAVVWHVDPLVAVQAAQAITFTSAPPSPARVGTSYSVTATGGASGNPVVFTTPNASCSVDGPVVSLLGVGECRITANQGGNSGYTAAPAVDQTFDVVKGDQTIVFTTSPPDPAFVGNRYSIAANGGASGSSVIFSSADAATCSVTGSTVTFAGAGSCRVLADQAGSANYNSAPQVAQSITIVKQGQAIAFTSRPPTPALLDGNYTLAATGGGSGNPVTFSSLTPTTCRVTGSSVGFIGVGSCILAANQAGTAAYIAAQQQTQQATVIYPFTGFFQPVDGPNTVNVLKIGKAVPVRFRLGGNRGLNVLQGTPVSLVGQCGNGPLDPIEETAAAPKAGLTYDAANSQYVYVWPTDKAWALGCRSLTLTLNDGTTHSAIFQLTK